MGRTNWPTEDFIELIAWLNYSSNNETINFADTVLEHLKASCKNEYTLEQVKSKLRWAWNNFGSKTGPQHSWNDLYSYGSQILPRLTGEQQAGIDLAQARIENEATAKFLSPRDRPRTRSASKSGNWRLSPHISLETFQTKRKLQYYRRGQTSSITPSPAKREIEHIDVGVYNGLTPTKRIKKASPLKPAIISIEKPPRKRNKNIPNTAATYDQTEIADSDAESHKGADNEAEQEREAQQGEENNHTRDDNEESSSVAISEPDYSANEGSLGEENRVFEGKVRPKSSTERAIKERLDAAIAEINELQQKLDQKQVELQQEEAKARNLQIQKESLQSAQRERDRSCGAPFETLIARKDQYIDKLKVWLADRKGLGTFTKSFQAPLAGRSKTSLEEGFKDVYSVCQQNPCQYDRERPLFVPALNLYDDLRLVVYKGLGIEPEGEVRVEEIKVDFSKLSPQAIVRAVTTSALREWVFEEDFPRFDSKSELFAKYRENIATLDGMLALRNLDLASYGSIINSEHFQKHSIPKKAKKLARLLSKILAPFFTKDPYHPKHADLHGFNTWGQKKEEYEERRDISVDIFTCALRTKAESILSLEEYEMVIYPPGTEFDKATMKVEDMRGMPQRNGEFSGRVVEICVQAAVFSYAKEKLGNVVAEYDVARFMGEALVKSKNFSPAGSLSKEGGRLRVPATVILREGEPPVSRGRVSDCINDDGSSSSSLTSLSDEPLLTDRE